MSIDDGDMDDGAQRGVSQLLARAAAAHLRADHRLAVAIEDVFLPEDGRLDDRSRAALAESLTGLVAAADNGIRHHAARLLSRRDASALAGALTGNLGSVFDRLVKTGLLRDPDLMRELIGRVYEDGLAATLPAATPEEPGSAPLLATLARHADSVVAAAATAMLAAEGRRHGARDESIPPPVLSADLHRRMAWWVAAALHDRFAGEAGDALPALDRALAEAASRRIANHDDGDRPEALAMRLACALDAGGDALADLLVGCLADRHLCLFIALIGHALGADYGVSRDIVLDPAADRLWLALRALELGREPIARIGLALGEADPRRDLEGFADSLDAIAGISATVARAALAPSLLPPDYRAAVRALHRTGHDFG